MDVWLLRDANVNNVNKEKNIYKNNAFYCKGSISEKKATKKWLEEQMIVLLSVNQAAYFSVCAN